MQTMPSTTADLMAPARVVLTFTDGSADVESVMPPARVPALVALTEAETNKRTVRQSDALDYGCGSCTPSAREVSEHLNHLTDLLSGLAHVMRSARWNDQPAPRVRDEFFPKDGGHGVASQVGVITSLVWIHHAAAKLAAPGWERTRAEAMGVIQTANRYPNISPRTEANLATEGHTTAECLTLMACTVAGHIAQAFERMDGPAYEQLRKDALRARTLLAEAKKVIDAGVAHTLGLEDLH